MDFHENPFELSRENVYYCSYKVPVIIDIAMKFVRYVSNMCRDSGMDFHENPLELSRENAFLVFV